MLTYLMRFELARRAAYQLARWDTARERLDEALTRECLASAGLDELGHPLEQRLSS